MNATRPVLDPAVLAPGTEVEVLTRYQDRWSPGFAVDAVRGDQYTLRRHSDGVVLPTAFGPNRIRRRR